MVNVPCPLLPQIDHVWEAREVLALGAARGASFYEASLHYAQSQWQRGLPAQALLQLNRALSTVLPCSEPYMQSWPLPYRAVAWIMRHQQQGQFMGNPRRHFQHLATRMTAPHRELRTWRAWACWHLSGLLLSEAEFPVDEKQICEEGLTLPSYELILEKLSALSPCDDVEQWLLAVRDCAL
jgi:hypothetical protein